LDLALARFAAGFFLTADFFLAPFADFFFFAELFFARLGLRMAVVTALALEAMAPSVAPMDSATLVSRASSFVGWFESAEVKLMLL
jgi:hypothetical protein